MSEIDLRNIQFGDQELQIAVRRRLDGKAIPRAMVAGIPANDIIDVVGASRFYYATDLEFRQRVDTPEEVAHAVGVGSVELGVVSQVPSPLQENVGVLLNIPRSNGEAFSVLGKISSELPTK